MHPTVANQLPHDKRRAIALHSAVTFAGLLVAMVAGVGTVQAQALGPSRNPAICIAEQILDTGARTGNAWRNAKTASEQLAALDPARTRICEDWLEGEIHRMRYFRDQVARRNCLVMSDEELEQTNVKSQIDGVVQGCKASMTAQVLLAASAGLSSRHTATLARESAAPRAITTTAAAAETSGPTVVQARPAGGNGQASINGIQLGAPLSAFVVNQKGYLCMANGSGRIALCRVKMERLNKCVQSPSGIKTCGVSVETADPALMQTWRYWHGAQMQEGATMLRFMDDRLVWVEMKPANRELSSLMTELTRLYGRPDKVGPAQWKRLVDGRMEGLSVSDHSSDTYVSLSDVERGDAWVAAYREDKIDESKAITAVPMTKPSAR
jgi:hypothetical protein